MFVVLSLLDFVLTTIVSQKKMKWVIDICCFSFYRKIMGLHHLCFSSFGTSSGLLDLRQISVLDAYAGEFGVHFVVVSRAFYVYLLLQNGESRSRNPRLTN